MATTYPQGYQQAGGGQPVVIQVVQQQKSSSDSFLKVCGCLAGTGLAICFGVLAGFLLLLGTIFFAVTDYDNDLNTTGIILLIIGGILIIGSCYACMHFKKKLEQDNNASAAQTLMGGQQAGRVYAQPQAAGQPIAAPLIPQPHPGATYPVHLPQQQQQQIPISYGQAMPPIQPGYIPGQMVPTAAAYPGQQAPPYPGQMGGPVPTAAAAYPGQPAPPYPGQMGGPVPTAAAYPGQPKALEAAASTSTPSAPMVPVMQTSEYDPPPPYAP